MESFIARSNAWLLYFAGENCLEIIQSEGKFIAVDGTLVLGGLRVAGSELWVGGINGIGQRAWGIGHRGAGLDIGQLVFRMQGH